MDKRINFHPYTVQKIRIAALGKQLIANLAVKTAARRGEILGLYREDIDLVEKQSIIKERYCIQELKIPTLKKG